MLDSVMSKIQNSLLQEPIEVDQILIRSIDHQFSTLNFPGVRIEDTWKGKIIHSPGWTLCLFKDGVLLWPAPSWMLELEKLFVDGTIDSKGVKATIQEWQRQTIARIIECSNKLTKIV